MTYYTKKPVTIEAFQLVSGVKLPEWFMIAVDNGILQPFEHKYVTINPHEGNQNGGQAINGNYIIKGIKGEIYACEADIFEATYDVVDADADGQTQDRQEAEQFDFGKAIQKLKAGYKVARSSWNGKGMYLYYVPENKYPASRNTLNTMAGEFPDDLVPYQAYIAMKTVQNTVVPWLASQTDVLADDWVIV